MIKLIELERGVYDNAIDEKNEELKKSGKNRLRCDLVDNMWLFLSVVITANEAIKQRGYVSYLQKGRQKHNPFLLCNGDLINDVELADMPILLSTAAYQILTSGKGLKRLQELNLLEQWEFTGDHKRLCGKQGIRSKVYYQLTDEGRKLIPEKIRYRKLKKKHLKRVRKYFHRKNGTERNEYKRLIKMLSDFEFDLPKYEDFQAWHLHQFENNDYQRDPTELCRMTYNQMRSFNHTDHDGFIMKCSSGFYRWAGRFYATPTFIKSFARDYLRVKGSTSYLMELDIQNSQFHMLNAVLVNKFGKGCTGRFDSDLKRGITDIYLKVAKEIFGIDKPNDDQRTVAKLGMFYCFFRGSFEPNSKTDADKIQVMSAVKKLYPELVVMVEKLQHQRIAGFSKTLPYWFKYLKQGSAKYKKCLHDNAYRKVSFCATCMETKIMKRLWEALYKEGISYLTVHDAILIDPKDRAVAIMHFERVLKEGLGYVPKVKKEQLFPPMEMIKELNSLLLDQAA